MPRDFRVYLDDILDAVQKIERYLSGVTVEQFTEDSMRIDAVVRNLQVIGEAARNIPSEIRSKYPEVEWQKMNGLRNIVIHEYFRVTLDVLWAIFQDDLPKLERQITHILEQEDDGQPP